MGFCPPEKAEKMVQNVSMSPDANHVLLEYKVQRRPHSLVAQREYVKARR
jgi:hypothetical protein